MQCCVVRRAPPFKLVWEGGLGSIRLTDVAIGRRHVQDIVPVLVPSFAHRGCAESVDEGLDVVYVSVTTGEKEIFHIIGRWRRMVHYSIVPQSLSYSLTVASAETLYGARKSDRRPNSLFWVWARHVRNLSPSGLSHRLFFVFYFFLMLTTTAKVQWLWEATSSQL